MKRFFALLLSLSIILTLLTACVQIVEPEELRTAIEAELNCEIRHDEDGAYQLFYPNAIDRDTFHQVFTQSQSYFPVKEGYTLTAQSFDTYYGLNNSKTHKSAWYLVETGGEKYYLYVVLTTDDGGTGFNQWNVMNEEDYQTFLSQSNT